MTTETLTLTDFLLARIAEDEATATGAAQVAASPWRWGIQSGPYKYGLYGSHPVQPGQDAWVVPSASPDVFPHVDTAAHVARHDPARILAECAAKRRIVEAATDAAVASATVKQAIPAKQALAGVLVDLATVYADHPDYDPDWRP